MTSIAELELPEASLAVTVTIVVPSGKTAPPIPWTTRPAIITPAEVASPRYNLPPLPALIVGRDDATAEVCRALMARRFLTIVGPGGIGKTTVAVSVAHALLNGFSGAVSFIDLSALTNPQLVPTAVASARWRAARSASACSRAASAWL